MNHTCYCFIHSTCLLLTVLILLTNSAEMSSFATSLTFHSNYKKNNEPLAIIKNSSTALCPGDRFQCLASFDGTRNQCVSFDSSSCTWSHCIDDSDKAFCYLHGRFFNFHNQSTKLTLDAKYQMHFTVNALPRELIQWLEQRNLSLLYSVRILKQDRSGSTKTLHSLDSTFDSPGSEVQHSVSGVFREDQSDMNATFLASVWLFVHPKSNLSMSNLLPVSPVVSDRFEKVINPPKYISPVPRSFHAHSLHTGKSHAIQIEFSLIPEVFSLTKIFTVFYQCVHNDSSNSKCSSADIQSYVHKHTEADSSVQSWLSDKVVLQNLSPGCQYSVWLSTAACFNTSKIQVSTRDDAIDYSADIDEDSIKVNASSISFAWTVPSWAPKTYNFSVTVISDVCQSVQTSVFNISSLSTVLSSLGPRTRFWFFVRACYAFGCGPRSDYATAMTAGEEVPRVDFNNVTVFNVSNIYLSWQAAKVMSSRPWRYTVYYDRHMGSLLCANLEKAKSVSTLSSHTILRDLDACAVYSVRVQVTAPLGLGHLSDITVIPTHYSSSAAPKSVSYTYPYDGNNTEAEIHWRAPCGILFQPVEYIIRITDLYTQDSRDIYIPGSMDPALNWVITDLNLGQLYRVQVITNGVEKKMSAPVVIMTDAFAGVTDFEILVPSGVEGSSGLSNVFLHWIDQAMPLENSVVELFGHNDLETQFHFMNSTTETHMRLRLPKGWNYTLKLRMRVHGDVISYFTQPKSIDLRQLASAQQPITAFPWLWLLIGVLSVALLALALGFLGWRHSRLRKGVRALISSYSSSPVLLLADTDAEEEEHEEELVFA